MRIRKENQIYTAEEKVRPVKCFAPVLSWLCCVISRGAHLSHCEATC